MSVTIKISLVVGVIVIALLAIIIGLIASSLQNLTSNEVGLQYDIHERSLKLELYNAGLHFGPPGYKFIKFPTLFSTAAFPTITCPNQDGLPVKMDVSYQYRPDVTLENIKRLVHEYRDFEFYSRAVKETSLQTIYDVCAAYNVTELQTERVEMQQKLSELLRNRLIEPDFLTNVRDVQINHIERPSGFEKIIREREMAYQKIELANLERERILSLARSNTQVAEAQANLTLTRAELDANLTLSNAHTHGQAVYSVYKTEAETYHDVMVNLNLTVAGVVSYLSTRMVQYAEKPININMESPAYTNYRNQSFVYERDMT